MKRGDDFIHRGGGVGVVGLGVVLFRDSTCSMDSSRGRGST